MVHHEADTQMNIPQSSIDPFGVLGFPVPIIENDWTHAEIEMVVVKVTGSTRTLQGRWVADRENGLMLVDD